MHRLIADADTDLPRHVVNDELEAIFKQFQRELPHQEFLRRLGQFRALNHSAAIGELEEGGDSASDAPLKPVAQDPTMWEFRWAWSRNTLLRQYHFEPRDIPSLVVIAKAHLKEIASGDEGTIRALQNEAISEARARYFREQRTRWGLDAID